MQRLFAIVVAVALLAPALAAQTRRRTPARRQPPPPKEVTEPAVLKCPAPLGIGVTTKQMFCDVLTSRDPAGGIIVALPPHRGPVTVHFDLHNRHTYSEEEIKRGVAFARYTATVGVLTMDNTLIERAVVQSEFRTAADLLDRIGGGAGPRGLKAVAPIGLEPIAIAVPAEESGQVSILGEKLTVERKDGSATYSAPGRPVATISNVRVTYRLGPATRKK